MDTNNVTILGCPGAPAAPTATVAATPRLPGTVPDTGGAPLESGGFSWTLVMVASVMGSLGAVVFGLGALGLSAQHRARKPLVGDARDRTRPGV